MFKKELIQMGKNVLAFSIPPRPVHNTPHSTVSVPGMVGGDTSISERDRQFGFGKENSIDTFFLLQRYESRSSRVMVRVSSSRVRQDLRAI